MRLSLITVCFNSEKTIKKTLDSIESQSYKNIEYIIIDGQSTDNTNEIIKSHKKKIDIHISEPDEGIFDAYNKGIRVANGDVIGFLNSDDFFVDNNSLDAVMEEFNKDIDIVFGNVLLLRNDANNSIFRRWKSGPFKKFKLYLGWMPPHPGFFIKRSIIDNYGFNTEFKIAGDYDFMIRHLLKINSSRVKNVNKFLTYQLIGGVSTTFSLQALFNKLREDIYSMYRNGIFFPLAIIGKNLGKVGQFLNTRSIQDD
tara:strand:+ start:668 stop:1432 length:765 start_codon:yes stop_codon:yes gene_type:complete